MGVVTGMEQNRQASNGQRPPLLAASAGSGQEYNAEIDLIEVFFALLNQWKALALAAIIGGLLMVAYHTLFVIPTFQAATEMYITNNDSVISLQDLQIGSALTEDYKSIITSRAVLNRVIDDLQLNTDYKGLRRLIEVENPSGTHILRTRVTTTDAELSRNIANSLLNESIDRIYQVVGTSAPTIIDYSESEAVEEVTPSMLRFAVIGAFVGMLLVMVFVVIRMLMDSTIKSDDDVEKYLKLPVLAAVPYYDE